MNELRERIQRYNEVAPHSRRLPEGWSPSAEKVEKLKSLGLPLTGLTWVEQHARGLKNYVFSTGDDPGDVPVYVKRYYLRRRTKEE